MANNKLKELAIRIAKTNDAATEGTAVLEKRTLSPEDWDQVVLAGCCTQGCCGDPPQENNFL